MRARNLLLTLGLLLSPGATASGPGVHGAMSCPEPDLRTPSRVPSPPPTGAATRLLDVAAEVSETGARIRLYTNGTPASTHAFVLDAPKRLVIDVFGLRDAEPPARLAIGSPHVRRLRLGRHPDKIRVVVDAGAAPLPFEHFETHQRRDGLDLNIGVVPDAVSACPRVDAPAPDPSRPPALLTAPSSPVARAPLRSDAAAASGDVAPSPQLRMAPSTAGAAASAPATRLIGVVGERSESGTHLLLQTDGPLGAIGTVVLENPDRLVIDLYGLNAVETPALVPVESPHAEQVRVVRHPDRIEVVVDPGIAASPFGIVQTERRTNGLGVSLASDPKQVRLTRLLSRPDEQLAAPVAQTPVPNPGDLPSHTQSAASRNIRFALGAATARLAVPRHMRAARSWHGSSEADMAGDRNLFARLQDGKHNVFAHNRIQLGLLDNRVRLTTRHGQSRFDATRSSIPDASDARYLDRILDGADLTAEAFAQRVDASLFSWGPVRVGMFGSYEKVDSFFQPAEIDGELKKKDFGDPGVSVFETGGTIHGGPLSLTLSQLTKETDVERSFSASRDTSRSYKAELKTSFASLKRQDSEDDSHAWLRRLAPSWAWVYVAPGTVDHEDSRSGTAQTHDLGAGVSWSGKAGELTLQHWASNYDNESLRYDWTGSGTNLDYGIYREQWDVYAGLVSTRYRSGDGANRSDETNQYGYWSFAFRPEHLPDFGTTLDLNRYEADYGRPARPFMSDGIGFQLLLDLSKYLPPIDQRIAPHLKTYYRSDWSRISQALADDELSWGHSLMATFEFDF